MAKRRSNPLAKIRRAGAIRPPKAAEMEARKRLQGLMALIQTDVVTATELATHWDAGPLQVATALRAVLNKWQGVRSVEQIAREWVGTTDRYARDRLQDRIATAYGVDQVRVFDDQTVRDAAELAVQETTNKITSISGDYIGSVARAVLQNYQQIPFPEGRSLIQEIEHQTGVSFTKAKQLARHQTSVITSAVNQARQTSVGIEEYYWESADDERVVGKPGGKYPSGNRVHGDHWDRDWRNNGGKAYRWDKQFHDGPPGRAPGCRCVARPKIDLDKLTDRVLI